MFVFGSLAGCVSVVFVVGFSLVLSFFLSFSVCVCLEIHTKALCVSLWPVSVVGSLCVSVCLLLWLASVVGVVSEVVECWGFFAFFFLAEKIQRFLGGCSLSRESFRLGWLLDCSSGGKEEEELVFGFLLLLLVRERTPLVTNLFCSCGNRPRID